VNPADGYTTRFTATARRDLDKLPPRILAAVIEFAFGDLARQPRRVGKPLGGELAGQYSARRGPYRLLYRIDDAEKTIWVHRVHHRTDVYRHP
jgi:mRNA interferase RelE/StbE